MRTLHVDTGHEDRGGQRQVALLLAGLRAAGHRVTAIVPRGAPLVGRLQGVEGVEVVEASLAGELAPRALPLLARVMRRGDFALVHAHTGHAVAVAHLARRLAGLGHALPLIAHRRVDFPLRRNPLARRKRAWPDAWIAVSAAVGAQLARDGVPDHRVFVVPSAVDPRRVQSLRPRDAVRHELQVDVEQPLLLSVGQLVAHKGHAVIVQALALARRRHPDGPAARAVWAVVGEGPLRDRLRAQVAELALAPAVRWLGPREDVGDLLGAADLALFPSLAGEGSPAAPKEAMLAGVPLLASDLPACRELGLDAAALVPTGDAPAWADRIAAVLADPDAPRAAAMQRRRAAERFTPAATCAATLAVYRQILDAGTRHPAPPRRAR